MVSRSSTKRSLTSLTLAAVAAITAMLALRSDRALATGAPNPACSGLPSKMLIPASTGQLVTARVADRAATTAVLQAWGRTSSGCFSRLGPSMSAFVGAAGTRRAKREGDGATPVGTFRLGARIFELGSPLPGAERHQAISCGSWWDSDPGSSTYNRFVQLPCGQRPGFGGASEALWLATAAYQHFVQIRYNSSPVVPGLGSAIFLHDSTGGPTAGCVALPPGQVELLLSWLDPDQRPLIAIGTRQDLVAG